MTLFPVLPRETVRSTVLVIDDQPINIQTVYRMLAQQHDVLMATSGAAGIEMCRTQQPDIVLLDLVMPEMDGCQVADLLKQDPLTSAIPVIFITASTDPQEESSCWDAGAVDFVTKPVNPLTLQHRIHVHLTLRRQAEALQRLAYLDGLTGIPNRRYFDQQAQTAMAMARRNGEPLTVMLGDVDFFKRYNDVNGHQAGDTCLCAVAQALQNGLRRPTDFVARYGGEEFALLLPGLKRADAQQLGDHLCQQVRALGLPHAAGTDSGTVSLSIGIACGDGDSSIESLLARADAELYRAKAAGRDRAWLEAAQA
jgi:diguanylate cyclase (GGDEF)-like protein